MPEEGKPSTRETSGQGKEEKLEFLKREEIRTMQKDIARLREIEAQKERERITSLKPKEGPARKREEALIKAGEERKRIVGQRKKIEEQARRKKEEALKGLEEERERTEEKKKIEERLKKEREGVLIKAEEERKRKEEEKRAIEKEEGKEKLEEKAAQIEKELEDLSLKKMPLKKERDRLLNEIEGTKTRLELMLREEATIEKKKAGIEEEERKATLPEKRSKIEKERWGVEQERREIEAERWKVEKNIARKEKRREEVESELQTISGRQKRLEKEREEILHREQRIELREEKSKLEKRISKLIKEKEVLKIERKGLLAKAEQIKNELEKCLKNEKEVEEAVKTVEEEEKLATIPREKRKTEKKRWVLEQNRQEIEKKKIGLQREKKELRPNLEEGEKNYQKALNKENRLKERIKEIDRQLGLAAKEVTEKKEEEEAKEERKEVVSFESEEGTRTEREMGEKIRQKAKERKKEEILKRVEEERKRKEEERRKMEEERRKREEAPKPAEKERIVEEKKKENEKTNSPPSIQKTFLLSKKPSPLIKILIRVAFVLLFLLLLGFFYWLFQMKKVPLRELILPSEEELFQPAEETEEKPEISLPSPLVPMEEIRVIEVSKNEEIPTVFNQIIEEEIKEGIFLQILIKNTGQNQLASLVDLSNAFQIEVLEEVYQKLEQDFTFFIFSQKEGKRPGIIAKIKEKQGLSDLLRTWEAKLEGGLSISGQEIKVLTPFFEQANYGEATFRYQSFLLSNYGICYSLFEDYFILTSSGESMLKIIDKLMLKTYE